MIIHAKMGTFSEVPIFALFKLPTLCRQLEQRGTWCAALFCAMSLL